MAKSYRAVDRDQEFLLPPDMREWLPEDHVVWFLIEAIEQMDTTVFHHASRRGGVGRRGYDPDMLLTLFVYAMAQGVSSSRKIEKLCATDVAFRVICAQDVPDHTVLARFRQRHEEALTSVLGESLVLAARLGMVSLGVVALDGTKIEADASLQATRTEASLRRVAADYVETVERADAVDDALFGEDSTGEGLPPSMRDRSGRGDRIKAALEAIEQKKQQETAADEGRVERARKYEETVQSGGRVQGGVPAAVDRAATAKARWQQAWDKAVVKHAAYREAVEAGEKPHGRPVAHPDDNAIVTAARERYEKARARQQADDASATKVKSGSWSGRPKANTTDPESRVMPTRRGWVQGFNCQTVTSADVLILAARVTQEPVDSGQYVPSVTEAEETLTAIAERAGREDVGIGTVVADAGYDSQNNLIAAGPDRLIANARGARVAARAVRDPAFGEPDPEASVRAQMDHRLRTPEGSDLYRQRSHLVETPNAWIKDRRGLRRFSRRGVSASQAELSLAAGVTNLLRIFTRGFRMTDLQPV